MCGNIFYNFISYKKYYSDKKVKLMFFMCFFMVFYLILHQGYRVIGGGNMVVQCHIPPPNPNPHFTHFYTLIYTRYAVCLHIPYIRNE